MITQEKTLYQRTRTGKIQQWKIWIVYPGDSGFPEVWIEHGQTDGKKQETHDVVQRGVNSGKANETSALGQAQLMMERKITKQRDKGYTDNADDVPARKAIDFDTQLPKELCFYKPQNSIDPKKLSKLDEAGNAIYTVKRDGMMHVVVSATDGPQIYSRRMDEVTDSYPHLTEQLGKLPHGTVLLGEMIFVNPDGTDDFNFVSQVCRSDPDKAKAKQDERGLLSYYVFDIAFYGGDCLLATHSFDERRIILNAAISGMGFISISEVIDKPHADAMMEVKARKLEGLVVFDRNGKMEDNKGFTFNGKAHRPNVLWKSKPKYEDDFIVRFDPEAGIGEYGSGKNTGKLKSVFVYQLDDDGNEVFLTKCGGGLTDDQRTLYTDPTMYPRVWRVEYDSIQPKTGSLRFPVFAGDRTTTGDKEISECSMSHDIKEARSDG